MKPIELSVVMPCLNEAETIEDCIRDALSFFSKEQISGEVVIGDNGSTDGSIELAKALGARVVHVETKGYGSACRSASSAAEGKYIIMGDSDRSYDFSKLGHFVSQLRDGADLVMGNRFKGGIAEGAMPLLNRYLGNPVLSAVGKVLFSTKIGDFHCGLRGYTRDAFSKMNLVSTGMEFASEMVMKATLLGLDIREVPTTLSKDGRNRSPHLKPWRDGWRHLRLMLLYSPKYLFLVPGLCLVALGMLTMLLVANNLSTIGSITFGPATMVYGSGFVVIGLQAILFSILAKTYGIKQGLLPPDTKIESFQRFFSVDKLILAGVIILCVSMISAAISVGYWREFGFGPLVPQKILSIAIPSSMGVVIGLEILLFGLFLGLMEIERHPDTVRKQPNKQA